MDKIDSRALFSLLLKHGEQWAKQEDADNERYLIKYQDELFVLDTNHYLDECNIYKFDLVRMTCLLKRGDN